MFWENKKYKNKPEAVKDNGTTEPVVGRKSDEYKPLNTTKMQLELSNRKCIFNSLSLPCKKIKTQNALVGQVKRL